ncbi:hypothetical protein ACJ41O_006597 [Fusarium nematophilum]
MLFSNIATVVAAFAMGAAASPAKPDPNGRYAQLRIHPGAGCKQPNLGEIGIRGSDINRCHQVDKLNTIRSLKIEDWTSNAKSCELFVYTDKSCTSAPVVAQPNKCQTGAKQYGSYFLSCH